MAESQQFSHNIFQSDPLRFKSYINKKVSVLTEDGNTQTGIVYTVDPVSESIILIQPADTTYRMKIIMGHAVKKIDLFSEAEIIIPELFSPSMTRNLSETKIIERKNAIKKLLNEHRIPFTEDNDVLQIEDVLAIKPPYELENFICTNRNVLTRIQKILSSIIK